MMGMSRRVGMEASHLAVMTPLCWKDNGWGRDRGPWKRIGKGA